MNDAIDPILLPEICFLSISLAMLGVIQQALVERCAERLGIKRRGFQ
jgi:hypothetical protein